MLSNHQVMTLMPRAGRVRRRHKTRARGSKLRRSDRYVSGSCQFEGALAGMRSTAAERKNKRRERSSGRISNAVDEKNVRT